MVNFYHSFLWLIDELTIEIIKLKINAHQKFLTVKPDTKRAVNKISDALMTKVNRPRVKILIGRVKSRMIGRIIRLISPKTKAATRAAEKLTTLMPGVIDERPKITKEIINHLISGFDGNIF